MASTETQEQTGEPDIILYDLASTKNICFSPAVWRIRLILNYKQIPYRAVFIEFPDIEPTLKALYIKTASLIALKLSGIPPASTPHTSAAKYTVPAIHHTPSNTYMMDSLPIAQFLETTYPDPPVQLTSELGSKIEARARAVIGSALRVSIPPRELAILSPRSQDYFRRTREAALGKRLEDLLDSEEATWAGVADGMKGLKELMRTNEAEGPFVLGERPSGTDFFIAGALQASRVVDEGVWRRSVDEAGFRRVYEALAPYMQKQD